MLDDKSTQATSTKQMSTTFSKSFKQTEGATYNPPYKSFFTDYEQEVEFTTKNTFAGKSHYFSYFPSTAPHEQQMQQVWYYHKNK